MAAPTWASPHTWAAGESITDTLLNAHVRDQTLLTGEHIVYQTKLAAAASAIDIPQLPQNGYESVRVAIEGRITAAVFFGSIGMQFSAGTSTAPTFDTAGNYDFQENYGVGATPAAALVNASTYMFLGFAPGSSGMANAVGRFDAVIGGHANVTFRKGVSVVNSFFGDTSASGVLTGTFTGYWRNTGPVVAIRIIPTSGNLSSGTSVVVYGKRSTSTST